MNRELGRSLWHQLTHVVILTQQNRVTDHRYAALLNRVAKGKGTLEDYHLLNTRLISNVDMTTEKFSNAPIVVPGNDLRMEVNRVHAIHNARKLGKHLLISQAEDTCTKFKLTPSKLKQLQSLSYTQTGGLPGELEIFVGLPVMLTSNIAVELQLTNGAMGVISRIPFEKKHTVKKIGNIYRLPTIPKYVVVQFHCIDIPKLPNLNKGEIPIFPKRSSFQYEFPGTKTRTSINRYQLPLVPSYCYTAYKAQSKTLPALITDLLPVPGIPLEPSFGYVPLSRVRSLNDIVILRKFPISVIQAKRSDDLIAQDKRFKRMDKRKTPNH